MGADERRWTPDPGPTPADEHKELKKQCDDLVRRIVRTRGRCQRCGSWDACDTAHLVPRRYSATRCMLANTAWLCRPCHTLIDSEPWWKLDLTLKLLGDDGFWELVETAEVPVKANAAFWRSVLVGLKAAAKDRRTVSHMPDPDDFDRWGPRGGDAA